MACEKTIKYSCVVYTYRHNVNMCAAFEWYPIPQLVNMFHICKTLSQWYKMLQVVALQVLFFCYWIIKDFSTKGANFAGNGFLRHYPILAARGLKYVFGRKRLKAMQRSFGNLIHVVPVEKHAADRVSFRRTCHTDPFCSMHVVFGAQGAERCRNFAIVSGSRGLGQCL